MDIIRGNAVVFNGADWEINGTFRATRIGVGVAASATHPATIRGSLSGDFLVYLRNTHASGVSGVRWEDESGNYKGHVGHDNTNDRVDLIASGVPLVVTSTVIRPVGDNTQPSGASNFRWSEHHVGGFVAIGTNPATSGAIRLANGGNIVARNGINATDYNILGLNSSDQILLSENGLDIRWGVPLVALGGGAAPTLGTIGGTGPATAAQNSWMRVLDNSGNPFWVPVWK